MARRKKGGFKLKVPLDASGINEADESDAELRSRAKRGIKGVDDDSGGADEGDYVKGSGHPLKGLNLPSEKEAKELRDRVVKGIAGSDDSGGADDLPKPSADLTRRRVVQEGDKLKGAPTGRDKGELIGHETVHTRQKGQVQFGDGLSGPKPRRESSNWTDYNVHDPGVAILKKVAIPIIVALVAACATLGFLYAQESNKLEDAQQALNKHIDNNTHLQAEVNFLQGDILALEAEAKTLSESLDVAKAAIRNIAEVETLSGSSDVAKAAIRNIK